MQRKDRAPAHLHGKEIGLWYAKQNQNKIKDLLPFEFRLDRKITDKIVQIVKDVEKLGDHPLDTTFIANFEANHPFSNGASDDVVIDITDVNDCNKHINLTGDEEFDNHVQSIEPDVAFAESIPKIGLKQDYKLDNQLRDTWIEHVQTPSYISMSLKRRQLPIAAMKEDIIKTIAENQVVIISGETGCGKTTQVPQFLLDDAILRSNGSVTRVLVTQPRRISAISVAERVAAERVQRLGEDVGYQIRLESRLPRRDRGSLLFCTTGIVLQRFHSDPLLNSVSHIVVDEVHEREMLGDFLITMLRRIAPQRPDLRIILMSATLNADLFSSFFDGCPKLEIPGRLFPVRKYFLEDVLRITGFQMSTDDLNRFSRVMHKTNEKRAASTLRLQMTPAIRERHKFWLRKSLPNLSLGAKQLLEALEVVGCPPPDLVAATIDYIVQTTDTGAILAFVPGLGDIVETMKALRGINPSLYAESSERVRLYPLHSRLPTSRQRCIFDPPPPNQRKIIVATNIAETSITIEDVVFVVDTGQIKMTTYDPRTNTSTLAPVLVSKANATQRRGRAGRVQPGRCYHLFSSFAEENVMLESLPPEITRIRLEDAILRIKILDLGSVTEFLQNCLDPPNINAIGRTLKFLRDIQALEKVTVNSKELVNTVVPTANTSRMSTKQRKRFFDKSIEVGKEIEMLERSSLDVADNDRLTPLGHHLANLPLDPQCAKLIVMGAIFCCLRPCLAVAACLAFKEPFEVPLGKQEIADSRRKELASDSLSDHWAYHIVLSDYESLRSHAERTQYCWRNFLNPRTMEDLLRLMNDFAGMLFERRYIGTGKVNDLPANRNSHDVGIFRAVLAGAFYPNFIMAKARMGRNVEQTPTAIVEGRPSEGSVSIHPKSVNSVLRLTNHAWLAYFTRMKLDHGAKSTIFDTTIFGARPLLFFSGKTCNLKVGDDEFVLVDDWIKLKSAHRTVQLVKNLKKCLDKLLDCKIRRPGVTSWDTECIEGQILQTIVDMFKSEVPTVVIDGPNIPPRHFSGNPRRDAGTNRTKSSATYRA